MSGATPGCRELRPLLGAHVLGALEPGEAAAVREHLAGCPACAAEHARLAPLPGLLTLADGASRAHEEPLAPILEERLLDAVAAQAPRRPEDVARIRGRFGRPRRSLAVAGVAAAALVIGVLVLAPGSGGPAAYDHEVDLGAVSAAPGATAHAELDDIPGGTTVHLQVSGLPGNPAAVYEVRCEAPDWSASAGTFRTDAQGRASIVLSTAARQGEYDHIRIVRRASGGDQLVLSGALS